MSTATRYATLACLFAGIATSTARAGGVITYTREPPIKAEIATDNINPMPGDVVELHVTDGDDFLAYDKDTKWTDGINSGTVDDDLALAKWTVSGGTLDVAETTDWLHGFRAHWTVPNTAGLYTVTLKVYDAAKYGASSRDSVDPYPITRTLEVYVGVDFSSGQAPGGLPSGSDITETCGAVAHLDLTNATGSSSYPGHWYYGWQSPGELGLYRTASKILRTDINWYATKPPNGALNSNDFGTIRNFATSALSAGIRPLFILEPVRAGYTYATAALEPPPVFPQVPLIPHPPGGLEDQPTIDWQLSWEQETFKVQLPESDWGMDFAFWAKDLVEYLSNNQVIWEIVNEPQGYLELPEDYADLCQKTIAAIRNSSNPNATILIGDVAEAHGDIDWPYLEKVLALLASPQYSVSLPFGHTYPALSLVDAVSVHPYRYGNPPEQAVASFSKLRMLLHKYSPGRVIPLFVSEQGYATNTDATLAGENLTEDNQAQYLVRQRLFNTGERVVASTWYDWKDDSIYYALDMNPNLPHDAIEQASGRYVETRWGMVTDWPVAYNFDDANVPAGWNAGTTFGVTPDFAPVMDQYKQRAHGIIYSLQSGVLSDTGSVFVNMNEVLPFGANSLRAPIGVWIDGDTSNCTLECEYTDSQAHLFRASFDTSLLWKANRPPGPGVAQTNYDNAWRYIEADLFDPTTCDGNSGPPRPVAPLTLQKLLVITSTGNPSGRTLDLGVDNITYTYESGTMVPKLSFLAAQRVLTELEGYHFVRYLEDSSADPKKYVMLLERDRPLYPAEHKLAMWTRATGSASFFLGSDPVTVTDMYGNSESRRHGDIILSQDPVYVLPGSLYASRMADLASWSWYAGTAPPATNGDQVRDSVIMGGQPFETTFQITNRSSTTHRRYDITFEMNNDIATAIPHDVNFPGSSIYQLTGSDLVTVGCWLEPNVTITIPVTLTTYRRDYAPDVTVSIEARNGSSVEYTDSATIPLILGNPLTLTAGPYHAILIDPGPPGVATTGATVGIEVPGLYSASDSLRVQIESGLGMGQSQSFSLPTLVPMDEAYSTVNVALGIDAEGATHWYWAQVLDSSDHVVASGGNTFLGTKVYDDTPSTGDDAPWPVGLSFDDTLSVLYSKSVVLDTDLGINYLHLYGIDFTQPKIGDTLRSHLVLAVTGSPVIPSGATGIGMWINPHDCLNKLMAKLQNTTGSFAYLQGYGDAEYNFNHTQDSFLLDWEGWRWVTIHFATPNWYTGPYPTPQGQLIWEYPFYIEERYRQSDTVDICGATYLM